PWPRPPGCRSPRPRRRARRGSAQCGLPRFAHELAAEASVLLVVDPPESGRLIEAPGGAQHAVGPQRDRPVARLAGEAHALGHQALADAEPARLRLDQEQTQLRHRARPAYQEDRAHDLSVLLGDPAALAPAGVGLDELPPRAT